MSNFNYFNRYVGSTAIRDLAPLLAVLALSFVLNVWGIWSQGITNEYYAAAVRSMLANPGVLFFNSLDAAGFVTVDKPPVGLWVQCLSAAILGFSGWSLVLPQALAGVGSVALVYAIVSRPFGRTAALFAAFALATTPIFVAVSRNGTMDGQLIFLLLLALYVVLRAARECSLPLLLLAAVFVGIGFNIKMIQAWCLVPALLGAYLVGARSLTIPRRVVHLGVALVVLVGVSLSWALVVDLVPADQRPYIGGSSDNSVLSLIVDYNGLHRLENGGTGAAPGGPGIPGGMNGTAPGGPQGLTGEPPGAWNRTGGPDGTGLPADSRLALPAEAPNGDGSPPMDAGTGDAGALPPGLADGGNRSATPPGSAGVRGGGMMDETGRPGLLRLFGEGLAAQIGWLLPFALIGLAARIRRPIPFSRQGLEDAGLASDRGLVLLGAALWLVPGLLYFSFTTGFWHTYYLATIAPPLAILVGCGAVALYSACRKKGWRGWLLPAAIAVTGLVGARILLYTQAWSGPLTPVVLGGSLVCAALLIVARLRRSIDRKTAGAIVCIALALLCLGPLVWACTPLLYGSGTFLPTAGPEIARSGSMGGPGDGARESGDLTALAAYLVEHQGDATYIAAASSSNSGGAGLIIATGRPVMVLGGFSGSDRILTTDELATRVRAGEVRYFVVGGGMDGDNDLLSWVRANGTPVDASAWGGTGGGYSLYACGEMRES
jgi:4-amino-4-deoxy-L-arabinose transferase-like glycosyltransferase